MTAYSYRSSIKSDVSEELVATFLTRPLAGLAVRVLYTTPVTPNQVTVAATVAGLVAAAVYLGHPWSTPAAGLLLFLKDVLDSADGQLARAKQQYSRRGRFLDSIGDFLVNLAVFAAISLVLSLAHANPLYSLAGLAGFLGISLRVSYYVFYQTAYLHRIDTYSVNRLSEEVRPEDRVGDATAFRLQIVFNVLYGWQDRLMARLDRWSLGGDVVTEEFLKSWFTDRTALRLSSFLGLGSELMLLALCSLARSLELYLVLNLVVMNLWWVMCIAYRRRVLREKLSGRRRITSPGPSVP